jgi:iron complex outermembrane receptor protein
MIKRTKLCTSLMIAFGSGIAALPALAQQTLERVEITGSSIKRIDAETALPVTIIRVEELTRQGITTAEQALSRIAANQSNFGVSQAVGATTGGKAEADLRGLSGPIGSNANKTLVLLNGRRLANHAFDAAAVDLNAIPLNAVDRIEILRDGASAIYGTDAIGGVINFILRRDFRGLELSASTQIPEASGGGDTDRFTATWGFGSLTENRFNVLASLDWRRQRVLEAADRPFSRTGILRGQITAGTSGTSFPGDLDGFEPTLPGCAPPGSIPNPAGTACRYDFSRDIDIIPENKQVTGLLRGSFAITPDHIASVEYLRANNKATSRVAAAPTTSLIPASSPFYPVGAPTRPITDLNNPTGPTVLGGAANWRQVPAGKRTSGDDTTTERTMAELQGAVAGWDYRAAAGMSRNRSEASVKRGYVNDGLMQQGVFNGLINPYGAQTPAGEAAIEAAQVVAPTMVGENRVRFIDFRVSKELMQMRGGPLAVAFGAEHRRERSAFEATDITAELGSLGIDPDSDTSGSRKVSAAFVELAIPVLKELEFTLAGRYDKYSDFGNTFNPKLGVRYQPTPQWLFRGSANKGFRAPTLYEINQPASLTFSSDNYNDPVLCPGGVPVSGAPAGVVCDQQVLLRQSGPASIGLPASTLQPEKSRSFTLGMVFEPTRNVTLGVDFWSINIKDLINPVPEQAIFGDFAANSGRFFRCSQLAATGPGITRDDIDTCLSATPTFDPIAFVDDPTQNLGELRTRGLDLSVGWRTGATRHGNFGVNLEGTYVLDYKFQRSKGGEFINALGKYTDNAPVFRWQHVLSANWSSGPWSAIVSQRFKTGYTDQDGVNKVGSYTLHDVSVSYAPVKDMLLTFGINNIFDRDPPLTGQVTTFQRGYDPRFTDPLGRSVLLRASYKFY